MRTEDLDVLSDLRKLKRQVDAAIIAFEAEITSYPLDRDIKVNQGYQIGDFVITPRFPKTDFQG